MDPKVTEKDGDSREISSQPKQKKEKNVLTRMEASTEGPLSLLHRCLAQRLRVRVITRNAKHIRGICTGYLAAFDKHCNLAMTDVDETYKNPREPPKESKPRKKRIRKKKKRKAIPEEKTGDLKECKQEIIDLTDTTSQPSDTETNRTSVKDNNCKLPGVIQVDGTVDHSGESSVEEKSSCNSDDDSEFAEEISNQSDLNDEELTSSSSSLEDSDEEEETQKSEEIIEVQNLRRSSDEGDRDDDPHSMEYLQEKLAKIRSKISKLDSEESEEDDKDELSQGSSEIKKGPSKETTSERISGNKDVLSSSKHDSQGRLEKFERNTRSKRHSGVYHARMTASHRPARDKSEKISKERDSTERDSRKRHSSPAQRVSDKKEHSGSKHGHHTKKPSTSSREQASEKNRRDEHSQRLKQRAASLDKHRTSASAHHRPMHHSDREERASRNRYHHSDSGYSRHSNRERQLKEQRGNRHSDSRSPSPEYYRQRLSRRSKYAHTPDKSEESVRSGDERRSRHDRSPPHRRNTRAAARSNEGSRTGIVRDGKVQKKDGPSQKGENPPENSGLSKSKIRTSKLSTRLSRMSLQGKDKTDEVTRRVKASHEKYKHHERKSYEKAEQICKKFLMSDSETEGKGPVDYTPDEVDEDYSEVLERHINQLFIRGDNVVLITLAD